MLKRAWFVICAMWAFTFIANGATKQHGITSLDFQIALAPYAVGRFLALAGRFIATGSPVRSRRPIPYRQP